MSYNIAYVFQHRYTGVQIFVYHCISKDDARYQFKSIVINTEDWIYLGRRTVRTI